MSQTAKHRESSSRYDLYQEDQEDQLGSKENYISGAPSPKADLNKNSSESDRPKLARQGSAQDLVPIIEKDQKSVESESEHEEPVRKQFKIESSSEESEEDNALNENSESEAAEKKKETTDYEDDEVYSADVSEDNTNRDNSSMMKTPMQVKKAMVLKKEEESEEDYSSDEEFK